MTNSVKPQLPVTSSIPLSGMDAEAHSLSLTSPSHTDKDDTKTYNHTENRPSQPGALAQRRRLLQLVKATGPNSPNNLRSNSSTLAERRNMPSLAISIPDLPLFVNHKAEPAFLHEQQRSGGESPLNSAFKRLQESGQTQKMIDDFYNGKIFDGLF